MFKTYFDLEKEVFAPQLIKYDCLTLNGSGNTDLFMDNAKVVNGVNLYQKFLDDHFYRKLDYAFGNYNSFSIAPKLMVVQDENGSKVKFSFAHYLTEILCSLTFSSCILKELDNFEGMKDLEENFKEVLRNERKRVSDVMKNRENSPYYEEFKKVQKRIIDKTGLLIGEDELLKKNMGSITGCITSFKYIKEVFDTEIDYHELMDLFDYDKLCLCIAKSAADMTLNVQNHPEIPGVDPTFIVCNSYKEAVEKMKLQNPNYNVTIKVGNKHYKSDEIKDFVNSTLETHENIKVFNMKEDEAIKKMLMYHSKSDIENMTRGEFTDSLFAIMFRNGEDSEYLASWEMLPKGESTSFSWPKSREDGTTNVYDEQMDILIKSREYIENTDYRFKLFGKGDFEGYVAFIYSTGTVILEKNNDRFTKDHNSIYNATYVMNYQNFMEFSMMSKTSIIEGIKSGKLDGVRRIFHTKNFESWSSKVDSAINASEYTEDVLKYINYLIKENQITKKAE